MFKFGNAGDPGNVNNWILFAVICFFVASAYFIFMATNQARERCWKAFTATSIVGMSFWALSGYVGWIFVSNM
ncbi:hypothetical protein [Serratia fonticola]